MHKSFYAIAAVAISTISFAQTHPVPAPATGVQGPAAPTPPAYTPVRWNEDYTYLRSAPDADFWDPIKYMPFDEDGDIYLSLGGQVRYRYEYFNNVNFGAGPEDGSGFHLLRTLAHGDLHLGDNFRFFVQGKSALEDDRAGGPRPTDEDELDLQQAFAAFKLPFGDKDSLTLRAGRQDLIYGAQRLISPLDWANTRRTFQGGKGSLTLGQHTLDAFWVRPIIVEESTFNNDDDSTDFAGLYNTTLLPNFIENAGSRWEQYLLYLDRGDAAWPTETTGDEERFTLGTRFYTNPKPWDFDAEAMYQFGDYADGDISAWAFATEGGYTFDTGFSPRPFIGLDIASGDRDPADGDLETFNQFFPLGHAYLGYIDAVGRQNIIDLHPGLELTLAKEQKNIKRLSLRLDYHIFWRQSEDDALYSASGSVQRAPGGSDERYVGSEVDLLLTWQVDRHLQAYVGYCRFFAADFIEETGPSEDIDFAYAAVQYTF